VNYFILLFNLSL